MKPKLMLCLLLAIGCASFGAAQIHTNLAVPVVAAPDMRECPEATTSDLGLWDDAFVLDGSDVVLLRKEDALFSYSPVTGKLEKIRIAPYLIGSRLVDGILWAKHQWVFCQNDTATPFVLDLAGRAKMSFEIPGVKTPGKSGPTIHAVLNPGAGPGTFIGITGDGAEGWPREGNRPLYYWMNLESGKLVKFPTGWDLGYFSADQRKAVFETISTNAWMYRPWVTVDMATGQVLAEPPDQTKGLWSEPLSGSWNVAVNPWDRHDHHRHIWQLRSPRTPLKLLQPQPGRGHADDNFVGLSVKGAVYPLPLPDAGRNDCANAQVRGNLAIFSLRSEGGVRSLLWAAHLNQPTPPLLLATNSDFELLDGQRCVLLVHNSFPPSAPEALLYDAESNTAWNVMDRTALWLEILAHASDGADRAEKAGRPASGIGPTLSFRLLPGFGSPRYPAKVLCLCSTIDIVPANVVPLTPQRMAVLLTAQGVRYEIHLPAGLRELPLDRSWLHNSGKLIISQFEAAPNQRGHLRLYVADLRVNQK